MATLTLNLSAVQLGLASTTFVAATGATNPLISTVNTVFADASSGSMLITLPFILACRGTSITIKKIDATTNTVTVVGFNGDLIDNSLTYVINIPLKSITVVNNGVSWYIV